MPAPQHGVQFQPLCHEHHIEMRLTDVVTQTESGRTQLTAYACPEPDCKVHFTVSDGYFLTTKHGQVELDMTPRVRCRRDGQPMYLAETKPEKTDFRLWRCPHCDSNRTSEEDLVSNI